MNLFENEAISISKIHMVNLYETQFEFRNKVIMNYNVNLPTYELVFFVSGENRTHFAGKIISDMPNSLRFLPKGISEGEYYVEKISDGICIDIYFDTPDPMPDFAIGLKNMNELKSPFIKIYNVWNSKKTGYYAESMSLLYDIIKKIQLHNEKYCTSAQAQKILPSFDYMVGHFHNHDFDYRIMCSKSGLSYDYFKKLFIKRYGLSPVKYVTHLRIERAKELLITGRYTITEIAAMCGFENIYYFSNVFKNHIGVSPGNYRISL